MWQNTVKAKAVYNKVVKSKISPFYNLFSGYWVDYLAISALQNGVYCTITITTYISVIYYL